MPVQTPDDDQRAQIRAALNDTIDAIDLPFDLGRGEAGDAPAPYRGKVRDVFAKGDELLLVATDRVSAFDVVLGTIPLKGQLLTEQSFFWLARAQAIAKTHVLERVDAAVLRCRRARAFPVELVVRGHLAGSLLREPAETRGSAYGLRVDPAMAPYQAFPEPVITPTTKEAVGVHDVPCSLADLVAGGRLTQKQLDRGVEIARQLFAMGQQHAAQQGLILVDTKYEFGVLAGDPGGDASSDVAVIDEVHTADSSRFWLRQSYAERVARGEAPEMLDKENLRRWLLDRGFSGHGTPPALDDAIRVDLAAHYWNLTERVLGEPFTPAPGGKERVAAVVRHFQKSPFAGETL